MKISAEIVTQNSFCIMRRKNISKYCQLCKNISLFWQNAVTTLGFETLKNISKNLKTTRIIGYVVAGDSFRLA